MRLLPCLVLALGVAPAAAHQDLAGTVPPLPVATAAERAVVAAAERWDIPAAQAALGRLGPGASGGGAFLRANVAFLGGDYAEAVRHAATLPPAFAADPTLGPYLRLIGATAEMRARLEARESEHFVLWHDPRRDWVLVEPALEALEAAWRVHGEWLGDRPAAKVRVEIVPSAEDFERVSSLTRQEIETSGAIGICKFNKILVLSPRLLLRGYPWRDALSHEYLHYLQVRLTANRAPIWLQEGVARYGETRWRDPAAPSFLEDADRSLLARALREDALIGFDAMDPSLVRLPSMGAVRLAYAECALAIEHLLERWGADGLRRVLAALLAAEEYRGMDPVLRSALGVTLAGFQEGWRAALAAKGFTEIPGLAVPDYRLAGGEADDEWDLAEWQPLAAQNHVRLGDMLRKRGNARAGLAEYERARGSSPASPFVHVKIARARLELGRPAEAAEAAREAVRLAAEYPLARVALAEALAALGQWKDAEAALRAALEINPFDPNAWGGLAAALGRQGLAGEARRAQETAARLAGAETGIGRRMP